MFPYLFIPSLSVLCVCAIGTVAQWLGRQSLAGDQPLIYASSMGKVSAMSQITRLTQPSIPPGLVNW